MGGLVMRKIIVIILLLTAIAFASCSYDRYKDGASTYIETDFYKIRLLSDTTALVIPSHIESAKITQPYIISTKCKEERQ